jgi:hypothetical protein
MREYSRGDPLGCRRDTLYPQKLVLTSATSGVHSVGIVRSRTQATEFFTQYEMAKDSDHAHHYVNVDLVPQVKYPSRFSISSPGGPI